MLPICQFLIWIETFVTKIESEDVVKEKNYRLKKEKESEMFLETAEQLTPDDIQEIERKVNINLPKHLSEHYLKYNGGIPDKPYFYSDISDIETCVHAFLPMKYIDEIGFTLEEGYLDFKNRKVIPEKFLPFAHDAGGNPFCINLENGQVVIIWLDCGEVSEEEICFLADDFDEFLNSLGEEDY